jgi:hypothetical protein
MQVLDFNLFSATFELFQNIESNLTFDPTDGTGTASMIYETEKRGTVFYNHLWHKFATENKQSATKVILAFQRSPSFIIRKFAPERKLPTANVIATISHFVENEFSGLDIHDVSPSHNRGQFLSRTYTMSSDGTFGKRVVSLWKEMTADEHAKFYLLTIRKIASYIIPTLAPKLIPPPARFRTDVDLLDLGYFPMLDFMNGAEFIWCLPPPIDMWSCTSQPTAGPLRDHSHEVARSLPDFGKKLVYSGDGTGLLSYTHGSNEDTFEFVTRSATAKLVYRNGDLVYPKE